MSNSNKCQNSIKIISLPCFFLASFGFSVRIKVVVYKDGNGLVNKENICTLVEEKSWTINP